MSRITDLDDFVGEPHVSLQELGEAIKIGEHRASQRILLLLQDLLQKTQGTEIPAVVVLSEAIKLIRGEQK